MLTALSPSRARRLPHMAVTLLRKGKRPLRFVGARLRHTCGAADDAISLWARQDGRLAVSFCVDGRSDAAVIRNVDDAGLWLEQQCMWSGWSAPPCNAPEVLAFLDTCVADRRWQHRLACLAQRALAEWPCDDT